MKRTLKDLSVGAVVCASLTLGSLGSWQQAHADASQADDAVVRAMRDELTRSSQQLQLPDAGKPYYMSLVLHEEQSVMAIASFGALVSKNETRSRHLRADVRVGSYAVDSSNMDMRGGVSLQRLPLDDDYDVVRHDVWYALDDAYKRAAAAYARKLALRESLAQDSAEVDDFSHEAASHIVVKRDVPSVDGQRAVALAKELSALAKKFPAIQSSEARIIGGSGRQVMLTSEDTFTSENDALVTLTVLMRTQAPDGMPLSRFVSYSAPTLDGLPAQAALAEECTRAATELTALRDAEQASDYTGPVLFEGPAAAQLFAFVIAPQLSGAPAPKSEGMRGMRSESELASKLGQRVLPAGFSLVDDPTLDQLDGQPLIGRSAADDEGMPAQKVALVQDGLLQDFLMSRAPRKGFVHSNGHAHGSMFGSPRASIANLLVTTSKGVSRPELTKKLLAEAKAAGQGYALIVRLLDDPVTSGDYSSPARRRGANVPPPFVLIKLTPDGKEQPLRGGSFGALPLSAFEEILAAGQTAEILNRSVGHSWSVAAPALLFKRVQVQKPSGQQRKLPELTHPYFEARKL